MSDAPKHTVVTSFAPDDWERYAHRFFETFKEYWDKAVRLVVVHEYGGMVPEDLAKLCDDEGYDLVPVQVVTGLHDFIEAVSYFPITRGEINNQYDINRDARMGRKAFIESWACETYGGKVFWVDADVITHEPVTTEWLDDLLPDDKLCCFLGREGIKMYTESGFIGYNAEHANIKDLMNNYRGIFTTGGFLGLPAWHDCVAFDAVRQQFSQVIPGQFNDIGDGVDPGPGLHVFINSVLGSKMDHLKGNRKTMPRSPKADLTVERTEAHWK